MMKKTVLFVVLLTFISFSFAQNHVSPEFLWKLGRVSDMQVSPDGTKILYGITHYDVDKNKGSRDLWVYDKATTETKQLTTFEGTEWNGRWRPDGLKIGFISARKGEAQLWEIDPNGGAVKMVSSIDGGISGFEYSPGMSNILFVKETKLDQTANEIHKDLPKANARIINDMMYRHWDSWHDYSYNHLYISNYTVGGEIGDAIDIMKDEPFDAPMNPWGGLEQVNWSPDGNRIAYACKKLSGKEYTLSTNSEIYIYELGTKETINLTSEGFEGYDHDPVFSRDGTQLLWKSMEEDGFEADKERMILYDLDSKESKDLTEGFDQSASHYVWSDDNQKIYFISGINATYQIYSYDLRKQEFNQITDGDHNYTSFALYGKELVGTKMSMSLPTEIFSINAKGKETQLTFTNDKLLKSVQLSKVEKRWIKTTDGKKMLTWVILPPDFDKKKKYPTLLYCQGGPQSAVSQFFSYRWNFQIMAANGYVVVAPNRRGLPTFGQEWNDQISGDYGGQNMKDYLSAIDEVAKESWVDETKLGAIGASYGGFSVFWLAGHHENRFKCFISHCGMFNLESQYGGTEEYFFVNKDLEGPYWKNPKPKSYDYSPHRSVDKWNTPILIITGANDFRIPYTESLQAFNAAQLLDVPSRLLFFPDESHFVLKPQNSILWQREFFNWLDEWLK